MRSTQKQVKGNKNGEGEREWRQPRQFITDQKCAQPSEREISSGSGVTQAEKFHQDSSPQCLGGCCPS